MIYKTCLFFLLATAPLCTIAQKAYETASYSGKVKGQTISFKLANGYIGASEISLHPSPKAKPILFMADSGAPDSDSQLTFKTDKLHSGYFILKNMLDAYDQLPIIIYGVYVLGNKTLQVKLTLDRSKI
jgi:hypothetical protein